MLRWEVPRGRISFGGPVGGEHPGLLDGSRDPGAVIFRGLWCWLVGHRAPQSGREENSCQGELIVVILKECL